MCVSIKTIPRITLQLIIISLFIFPLKMGWSKNIEKIYPATEPEIGEDFTDDYKVILGDNSATISVTLIDKYFNAGQVELRPWSDSYWPVYKGLIASRYADKSQPDDKNWYSYYSHYISKSSNSYVSSGDINILSPSEKYDLLIGDSNWNLTQYMWNKGKASFDKYGSVATWTGICHGWAAASQIGMPTPNKDITISDVTGRFNIRFNIFDIMALTSYYFAKTSLEDRFTGRRCRNPNPPRDGDRITDGSCFDINPMTWHLAVVNQVGKYKKSFIMDTSSNTEVWNYVIDSYELSYYNPITGESFSNLSNAIVRSDDYNSDPYKKYRSERAHYIVGIYMNVYHPGAISPHTGSPAKQLLERKKFVYELELDSQKNIIGGEWASNSSPDFIWLLPQQQNPFLDINNINNLSTSDQPIVDADLASQARVASEHGRTHKEVVYRLLHKSLTGD